jgi:hypothetical protein
VRADLGPRGGRGGECSAAKRMRRLRQEQRDASPARDAGLTAGSVRFRRRVRMQGNQPRACRLGAVDVGAEQKRRTGDATKRGDPAGGYAGVSTVFLQHTRVSSGGLAHKQENTGVRRGVGTANQSGSIVLSHKSTTSNSSYSSSIVRAGPQHLKKAREPSHRASLDPFAETTSPWQSRLPPPQVTVRNTSPVILHPLQSPGKLLRHPRNLVTVELFSSPILFIAGIHFLLFFSTIKVTPRFAMIH